MKFFIAISIFLLTAGNGYTQQLHFAYLQTDSHKPFYVSINKKNYSSTASGYIILPRLQNGDYPVRIGFAKSEVVEQEFTLQVKDNDQGFLIKDFGDKGWGLFNLQTMTVQYAGAAAQERAKLAAAEKAAEELRQQKLQEEMLAAEKQKRDDSLKNVMVLQQRYNDSVATVTAANTRLQKYNDSIAGVNRMAQQNRYNDSIAANAITQQNNRYHDSVAKAKAIAVENQRLEKIADSAAVAQAVTLEKQKEKTASLAAMMENERLQKIADSTAKAQAAATEKEKVKAALAENERLKKIADSTAKAQAAALEKQKEKNTIALKPDTNKRQTSTPPENVPPYVAEPDTQRPVLLQQIFTDSGWHYAYRVTNKTGRETIDAFIPAAQPKLPVTVTQPNVQKDTIPVIIQPSVTDSSKFLNINVGMDTAANLQKIPADTTQQIITPIIVANAGSNQGMSKDSTTIPTEKSILNSNCKALANEKDFFNIRKKIASAIGTEQMLAAARKQLKEKCYTTEQLRNLSVLFLTDAGRYQFLDAAYLFAFDAYRYNTLQDLFIDPYYLQRFKSMLH